MSLWDGHSSASEIISKQVGALARGTMVLLEEPLEYREMSSITLSQITTTKVSHLFYSSPR